MTHSNFLLSCSMTELNSVNFNRKKKKENEIYQTDTISTDSELRLPLVLAKYIERTHQEFIII